MTTSVRRTRTAQQEIWASGDFPAVAARMHPVAEQLVLAADLRAGAAVLDVATGTGNAAIAAARCVCAVTGVDFVPALLVRGRTRAAAEGFAIEFVEGDAEDLPFPDASFDAVLSVFGVMFAPDQEKAASELLRVCRPGATIALASWVPDGFVGEFFALAGRDRPAAGPHPPTAWGTAQRLQSLLGNGVRELETTRCEFVFRSTSVADWIDFMRTDFGPLRTTFDALDPGGQERLHADLSALCRRYDRGAGTMAIPAAYLRAIGVTSS
jgi:SAM-dependent methyltransferase